MAKKTKDAGHDETEKVLAEIEKRIAKEYSQAEEEVAEKLDKYMKSFEAKDKKKQKDLKAGLISQSEYDQWKVGQIAMGRRWEELRQNLAEDFTHADQIARSITGDYMPEVYAINHNYGTYQIEKGTRINTNYTLYDAQTVERLADVNDDIIPVPGKKLSKAINEGKAVRWNNQQIQSVMMQSILQGESIPKIAKRLSREVGEKDRKAAVRNARTLTTCVQNRGRVDSYKRAQKLGIDLEQQWVATLDGRTRHEHRLLDGQTAPVGGKFKVEGYEIEYPGDPTAPGFLIYNCRCTLIASIKGWEFDLSDRSLRYDDKLGDMTYEEWKYGKKEDNVKYPVPKASGGDNDDIPMYEKPTINETIIDFEKNGVERVPFGLLDKPLSEEEIIRKIGQYDTTCGSCASAALAYASNKFGYDVEDFRGGESQKVMASSYINLFRQKGVDMITEVGPNDVDACKKLLETMKPQKEYILITGEHAAVVRRNEDGLVEYLELQYGVGINGYKKLTVDALYGRFKCELPKLGENGFIKKASCLVDMETIKDSHGFTETIEYINTKHK